MLESQNLKFHYKGGPSFEFPDFQCPDQGHLLLLGQSGTGKTTLLHLLAGILKPESGKVIIKGQDITSLSNKRLDQYRGEHIGIVYQSAHFISSLSVEDNLIMPHFLTGEKVDREKARSILKRLQLSHKLKEKPGNLSVGEQQRVAIARALMNNPDIILADEPSSALDDKNAEEVIQLLEEQSSIAKASLIIVTHDKRLKDRFSNRLEL